MKRKRIRLTESQLKTLILLVNEANELEELEEMDELEEAENEKFSALKGFKNALKSAFDVEIKSIESLYA